MSTTPKNRNSTRGQLIRAVNSPLGFYVLSLLIVEAFLETALIRGGLQPDQVSLVIKAGLAMFVLVVVAVFLLVWFKPTHIMFDKEAHLEKSAVYSETAAGTILKAFWKPDGKNIDQQNEKRLTIWMEENRLEDFSISTFLIAGELGAARARAIRDLKISSKG